MLLTTTGVLSSLVNSMKVGLFEVSEIGLSSLLNCSFLYLFNQS